MSWREQHALTITAHREEIDKYGGTLPPGAVRTIEGCTDWPVATSEDSRAAVQTVDRRTLSLPAGEQEIPSNWVITYPDGRRWRIIGESYPGLPVGGGGVTLTIERRA